MVATQGDNELITICVQRSRVDSLKSGGKRDLPAEPALDSGSGTAARVPGGDPGVCRAPWEKRRGKDVEARVCSPSKCKGVNAILGEGASDLSAADFTGIALELDFIPGAVGSHYRLSAGDNHNPNICFLNRAFGCCVQSGEKKVAWKGGIVTGQLWVSRGCVGVAWACSVRGKQSMWEWLGLAL